MIKFTGQLLLLVFKLIRFTDQFFFALFQAISAQEWLWGEMCELCFANVDPIQIDVEFGLSNLNFLAAVVLFSVSKQQLADRTPS